MKKNSAILIAALIFIAACSKVADIPVHENGVGTIELTASKSTVAPTRADSNTNVISFSWTNPKYATDSSNYKYILELDSAGRSFATEATRTVMGGSGTSLTGRELNAILINYGFALGVGHDLDVRVTSSYGNNNERYFSNVVKIRATPFNDSSVLATSNTSVTGSLATASQPSNTFSWSQSFKGYSGNINYVLQYDSADKNFVAPLEIPVGSNLYSKLLTQGEMNETALKSGIPGGNSGKVEYRIKATTASGIISYSNVVMVAIQSYLPIVRFYLPGSYQAATGNGNDWDPGTAPEFIRDLRSAAFNKLYYIYIYLPAGALFKVTQGRSWDVNYGGTGGNLVQNGDNFTVTTSGYYRISLDRINMKYDIREGRMGFVGGGIGAGWNPGSVFPNYAMGAAGTNLFVGLTDFTLDQWKMIDTDQWDNGSLTASEPRNYGSSSGSGSTLVINGTAFSSVTTAGRYRAIWDGRNVDNIKYEMSPASEMRVVGDGINQAGVLDWDPASSPQMTYIGNGKWQISITLKANKDIKFLAGGAWGAFDYEDNSGGNNATGVPKKIKWEGGSNFKTPASAGTFTITLDENAQTVMIN